MTVVYFLYGLSFFALGFSLLVHPTEGSKYRLAKTIRLIACFGILHSANEWIDMFALIQGQPGAQGLKAAGLILLPASFSFLVLFGTRTLALTRKRRLPDLLHLVLILVWAAITSTSTEPFVAGSIWARYLLGLPGILLTCCVFIAYIPVLKERMPSVVPNLAVASGAFFAYGIFATLTVPEAWFFPASLLNEQVFLHWVGVPVQVVRALCALAVCFSTLAILRIFDWESRETRTLSITDEWTELLNRRGFFALAEQQHKVADRLQRDTLLIAADVDGLKKINDRYGHKVGDKALIETAHVLRESFRDSDIIARIGGDEFAVFQIGNVADLDGLTDRMQKNIDSRNESENREYELSISVGAAFGDRHHPISLDEKLNEADRLMYEQKRGKQLRT